MYEAVTHGDRMIWEDSRSAESLRGLKAGSSVEPCWCRVIGSRYAVRRVKSHVASIALVKVHLLQNVQTSISPWSVLLYRQVFLKLITKGALLTARLRPIFELKNVQVRNPPVFFHIGITSAASMISLSL